MTHRQDNEDCPWTLSQPVDPEDMYDVGDCTCKPTAADRLAEIRARHEARIKPRTGASVCESQVETDMRHVLALYDKLAAELEQVKADYAELVLACDVSVTTHESGCTCQICYYVDGVKRTLAKLQGSKE